MCGDSRPSDLPRFAKVFPENRMFRLQSTHVERKHRSETNACFTRVTALLVICCAGTAGCHDGPLYALKQANPYFVLKEWRADEKYGVTDHERRETLMSLAQQIGKMSAKDQMFWAQHLDRIMKKDPSPEMRRLAVLAAGRLESSSALALLEEGLGDENLKVQMEACKALANRKESQAVQLLASTLGTTTEQDVKNTAIAALGNHRGNIPVDALRIVLNETDPATVDLAINSLRGVIGTDYGDDPKAWIAAIDSRQSPPAVPSLPGMPGDGSDRTRVAETPRPILR